MELGFFEIGNWAWFLGKTLTHPHLGSRLRKYFNPLLEAWHLWRQKLPYPLTRLFLSPNHRISRKAASKRWTSNNMLVIDKKCHSRLKNTSEPAFHPLTTPSGSAEAPRLIFKVRRDDSACCWKSSWHILTLYNGHRIIDRAPARAKAKVMTRERHTKHQQRCFEGIFVYF